MLLSVTKTQLACLSIILVILHGSTVFVSPTGVSAFGFPITGAGKMAVLLLWCLATVITSLAALRWAFRIRGELAGLILSIGSLVGPWGALWQVVLLGSIGVCESDWGASSTCNIGHLTEYAEMLSSLAMGAVYSGVGVLIWAPATLVVVIACVANTLQVLRTRSVR